MLLYNHRRESNGRRPIKITKFRELVCISLMQINQQLTSKITAAADIMCEKSCFYDRNLQETDEKEVGKRQDRRNRRYCIGSYENRSRDDGRDIARKKAKRVTSQRCAWGVHCFIIC